MFVIDKEMWECKMQEQSTKFDLHTRVLLLLADGYLESFGNSIFFTTDSFLKLHIIYCSYNMPCHICKSKILTNAIYKIKNYLPLGHIIDVITFVENNSAYDYRLIYMTYACNLYIVITRSKYNIG